MRKENLSRGRGNFYKCTQRCYQWQPFRYSCQCMNRSDMPLPQGLCHVLFFLLSEILILLFMQISSQLTSWRDFLCPLPDYKIAPFLAFILLTQLYFFSQHCIYLFVCGLQLCGFHLQNAGFMKATTLSFFCSLLYRLNTQKLPLEQIRHSKKFDTFMCLSAKSLCSLLSVKS